jgi:hypothetical protein
MTLAEFLLARISEDEAAAAGGEAWHVDNENYPTSITTAGGRWTGNGVHVFDPDEDALHIARWDPARVLAECDAKRRIIADHAATDESYPLVGYDDQVITPSQPACRQCTDSNVAARVTENWDVAARVIAPCDTVRFLALPYLGHPDYQEEWKP